MSLQWTNFSQLQNPASAVAEVVEVPKTLQPVRPSPGFGRRRASRAPNPVLPKARHVRRSGKGGGAIVELFGQDVPSSTAALGCAWIIFELVTGARELFSVPLRSFLEILLRRLLKWIQLARYSALTARQVFNARATDALAAAWLPQKINSVL